jgi:hypothetical protein
MITSTVVPVSGNSSQRFVTASSIPEEEGYYENVNTEN